MIGRPCRAAVSAPTNQARPRHVNNPIHHHADTSRHSKHNRGALTTYHKARSTPATSAKLSGL